MDQPFVINFKKHYDDRGFFMESFNKEIKNKISADFVQDNCSYSKRNVIRGMHYQWDEPMGKLVFCAYGKIMDVVVDIRKDSPDLGKVYYFWIGKGVDDALWVPPGFAHGFQVVSDEAVVTYKCSSYYNNNGESGINPFDNDLNILWNYEECTVKGINRSLVSKKDINAQSFEDYCKDFKF